MMISNYFSSHSFLSVVFYPPLSLSTMEDKAAGMEDSKVQQYGKQGKGGFRATVFVYVLVAFESMGLVANMSSLVLYFLFVMHFNVSGSSNTLTNFMGSTFMLALLGGFISDTYLTRLHTCLIFGVVEVLALVIITIQAHYPNLHPDPLCPSNCLKGSHAFMFYTSLALYALGAGGMRGALPALGGEQFDPKDPKEKKALTSYFNWYLFSLVLGASFGVTVIVKLGMDHGWDVAFFICTLSCVVGFMVLAIGKPFYRVKPPGDSPILRIIQVIGVAFRNRKLTLPEETDELYEINDKESSEDYEKLATTKQFRFLTKAAILGHDSAPGPWEVCTVTQVEEVKVLIRMLPIIASTIIMNTCLAQLQTFSVQQGQAMNRFLGSFEVPAPSVPVIPLVFIAILIPVYEFVFIPVARKFTHHPAGITQLQRVGVGLVLSAVSMSIAAIVEVKRRNQDIKYHSTKNISLFWVSFQYAIFGIADMFTLVGLMEFFYKEAPSGMKSLSTSFTFLSLSIGYFLSSVFVSVINSVTAKYTKHRMGWLEAQILNDNHLDLFYWFLAILSCINFANYLHWASWYKYKQDNSDSELSDKLALVGSSFHKEEGNAVVDQLTRERPSSPNQSDMKHEVPMGSSNQQEKTAKAHNTTQNSSAEKIGETY